jgi:MYXO-CTERM domain-containing protein
MRFSAAIALAVALNLASLPAFAGDPLGCCVCSCPSPQTRCINDATESECPAFCIGGDCVMQSFGEGNPCSSFHACAGGIVIETRAPLMSPSALGATAAALAGLGALAMRRRRTQRPNG